MYNRISAVILVGMSILLSFCRQIEPAPVVTGMESKQIPSFDILLPDGATYFNTQSIEAGRRTILFYYLPTCPYCRMQMRDMIKNINEFSDVLICVLTAPDFPSMKAFAEEFNLGKYKNIITGVDTGYIVQKAYRVTSIPFTAIFDADKKLRSAYTGSLTGRMLTNLTQR